jgi:hypothetical protein
MRFVTVADRIHAILLPRLEALTKVDVFKDIKQIVSLEGQGLDVRGFHGRTTTLSIPFSDACPAKVQLSFRLGHDGPVENAIMDYRLEILPIFFKFDSHDQLTIPISHPNEDAIAGWIEDKLVGFTQTFFELHFHNQYQQKHLETDLVMTIRFPKAYAAGKKGIQGAHLLLLHTRAVTGTVPGSLAFSATQQMLQPPAEATAVLSVIKCGALLHKSELIIAYGLADHSTGFATVPVGDVLAAMACAEG